MRLRTSRLPFLFCALLASGCRPGTGSVTGTVTFKGESVPSGSVSFFTGGKLYEAEITNGAYVVRSIPPGEATITVIRLDLAQPDPNDALIKARAQMIAKKAADPRAIDPAVVIDPAQLEVLQKKRHLLPLAYSSPNTSDLRFKVTVGANTFNIDLHDEPIAK